MQMPGLFNVFGYSHDTREDYPEDVSRVVSSVPADEDSFYPDSDSFPGAVRTVHNGALSFVDDMVSTVEEAVEGRLGDGDALPDHIRAGLVEPPKPVEVMIAQSPGGAKGRVVKFSVRGGTTHAQKIVIQNERRRTVSLYNYDGGAVVFWGFSSSEAEGGVAGDGFPLPAGGTVTLNTQQDLWFSTDSGTDVPIRSFMVEDV